MNEKNINAAASIFISVSSFAQNKVSADSASKHVGETVTICSKVFGTKSLETVTFINVGAAYPNSPLTIVIFAKDIANFKTSVEDLYNNKNICVTGVIKDYNGRPEIVVTKPEEIIVQ